MLVPGRYVTFFGRDAKTSATQSGRNISRLSIATTKRYKDANDEWQEKTQWHSCVAYGPTADYAAKIPTGAHVFLEGELTYREYERTIETESGPIKVQWPVTRSSLNQSTFWTAKTGQKNEGSHKRPLRHQVSCSDQPGEEFWCPQQNRVGNSTEGPFSRSLFAGSETIMGLPGSNRCKPLYRLALGLPKDSPRLS